MSYAHSILIINPGSTSTKIALSQDDVIADSVTIAHSAADLKQFISVLDQFHYRLEICLQWICNRSGSYSAVVAMGGLLRPVQGGTYRINNAMLNDARNNIQGEHASNLGCALAYEIASRYDVPSFVVDPVSVDEFEPLAHYSGHPLINRRSLSHALNIHVAAHRAAHELNIELHQTSFVIGHLGGGISIASVRGGRIIDVNDGASDGPFSPERTGGLPLQQFMSLCFSGSFKETDLRSMVMGKGGLASYLGTNSVLEVEERIASGDTNAREVYQAMAYQIAKEIGAMATVLSGHVDAIVLTGGLANSKQLMEWIRDRIKYIAPVVVYPGEHEMQALAEGALRVLRGEEQAKEY